MTTSARGLVLGPVLGLETSGTLTGAALWRDGRLLAEAAVDATAGGSQERLLSLVQSVLQPFDLRPRALRRIGVALGPGSFTGLRVGLGAARGLAWGAGVPLVGVPSHEALAWPWRDDPRTVVLLSGLRRGEVYFEAGRFEGCLWRAEAAGASVPAASLAERLRGLQDAGRLLFVGEAVESLRAAVPDAGALGEWVTEPLARVRRPAVVALLAAREEVREHGGTELERLLPLYLRGADAKRPAGSPAEGRNG